MNILIVLAVILAFLLGIILGRYTRKNVQWAFHSQIVPAQNIRQQSHLLNAAINALPYPFYIRVVA